METFVLFEDFITLGQLLKELGLISTGGAAKHYLAENEVLFNGTIETRRGKKLYAADIVVIPLEGLEIQLTAASAEDITQHAADEEEKARVAAIVREMNVKNKAVSADKPATKPQKPRSPFHK